MRIKERDPTGAQPRERTALIPKPHHNPLDTRRCGRDHAGLRAPLLERNVLLADRNVPRVAAERDRGDDLPEGLVRIEATPANLLEEEFRDRSVLPALQRTVLRHPYQVVPACTDRSI